MASDVGLKELLEAGVHFGHQTRRWNPKMRRFIHGERGGIYIIDLLKTAKALEQAEEFVSGIAHRGGTILFVGTKKQARDAVKETAEACGMPYVNNRWLGGVLTNFQTISQRIKRLHDLERYETEGQLALLPTQERMKAQADLAKLRSNLGGVKNMARQPDAMFVVDLKTEAIAVKEAQRLRIPIIGLVDTNCDPDGIQYVIPGNDDAMKACRVITEALGNTIKAGRSVWQTAEEERMKREAEEAARRAAEIAAAKQAEEAAKQAEEDARAAAERTEVEQGEVAASRRANEPMQRGAPGQKPIAAPTVAEDLPVRPQGGARRKRGEGKPEDAPSAGSAAAGKSRKRAHVEASAPAKAAPAEGEAPTAAAAGAEAPAPTAEAPAPDGAVAKKEQPAAKEKPAAKDKPAAEAKEKPADEKPADTQETPAS